MPEGQFNPDEIITAQEYDDQPAPPEGTGAEFEITATDTAEDDAWDDPRYWKPQQPAAAKAPAEEPAVEPSAAPRTEDQGEEPMQLEPTNSEPTDLEDPASATEKNEAAEPEIPEDAPEAGPPADTALPRAEVLEQFEKWKNGETVPSEATPIGKLPPLSEAELALIADIRVPYHEVTAEDMHELADEKFTQHKTGFTAEQLKVLAKLDDAFMAIVKEDLTANDFGEEPQEMDHVLRVGVFDFQDVQDWHVDKFGFPCARYVVSLGEGGATQFVTGEMNRKQTPAMMGDLRRDINIATIGQQTDHGVGVVSRFLANQTIHRTPVAPGFRIFITVSSQGMRPNKEQRP
jgi:hypothetical protein